MLPGDLLLAIAGVGSRDVSPDPGHVPGALILLLRDRQMLLALLQVRLGAHVDGAGSRCLICSAGAGAERQKDPDIANHCDSPSLRNVAERGALGACDRARHMRNRCSVSRVSLPVAVTPPT